MKTDVIIIGAELDGLIAATRLVEYGYTVRILAVGAGSLHYSSAGEHVLGFDSSEQMVKNPFEAIESLNSHHPYRRIGTSNVRLALEWFYKTNDGSNILSVSPAGLGIPVYRALPWQATFDDIKNKNATIVQFRNHGDFTAHLASNELNRAGYKVSVLEFEAPDVFSKNAALAKSFDRLEDPASFFLGLKESLSDETEVLLFAAVMGFKDHQRIMNEAEKIIGIPCREVSTLPPSIPGMRLDDDLTSNLKQQKVSIHSGVKIIEHRSNGSHCIAVTDDIGRSYEASIFIVSTGGVLMGGLDIDSHGNIHETSLGLEVYQSEPLSAVSVDTSLHALHMAGVETDNELRPLKGYRNVCVTGRSLSHWNPAQESSCEGVCISTGWVAAETAHNQLMGMKNG